MRSLRAPTGNGCNQPKAEAVRFRFPIRGLSCGNTLQSRLRHLRRVLERGEYTPTQLVEYASHAGRTGTQIGLTGLQVSGLAYTVFMGSETGGSALRDIVTIAVHPQNTPMLLSLHIDQQAPNHYTARVLDHQT